MKAFPMEKAIGQSGMDLRDYFAAKALTKIAPTFADIGELTSHGADVEEVIGLTARHCYELADAMLAERDK